MAVLHSASNGSDVAWIRAKCPPAIHFSGQASKGRLQPIILTLALDERSFRFFDELRTQFFPIERNHLPAHISLFHHLPGEQASEIASVVANACSHTGVFPMQVSGLRSLGRGVAYLLESPALLRLRAELASEFQESLTRQDQQRFQPHITVQNKVSPYEAESLLHTLRAKFQPFSVTATGVLCWRYLGGPWELIEEFPFAAD